MDAIDRTILAELIRDGRLSFRDVPELDELVMALPRDYGVMEMNTRLVLRELAGSGTDALTRLLG